MVQTVAPLIFSDNLGQPKFNLDIPERLPVIEALFEGQAFNPDGKDESIQTMYRPVRDIEAQRPDGRVGRLRCRTSSTGC